ncbi:MAG: formate dehydrogenase accessory sulfurtransferase FdhD [Planctomycetes bacterium]|nr:formate dehydrogenase accessory sulfurtransferase FdhD [Planctomycetota bacterium]
MLESQVTGLAKTEVIVINKDGIGEADVEMVPAEQELTFVINNGVDARFYCAPHRIKALVMGWLVGEGIIENPGELVSVETDLMTQRVDIRITDDCYGRLDARIERSSAKPIIGEAPFIKRSDTALELNHSGVEALAKQFRQLFLSLKSAERMSYLASVATEGEILTYGEGFHRINALYRSIGELVRNGQSVEGKIALTNFGLSQMMVSKLARAGIAMVICFAPPTSSAIQVANDYYVTLVCVNSGEGTRIYSAPWRVI